MFDAEKAILVCMARKLYGDTNIYNEVLKKYSIEGVKHYAKHFVGVDLTDADYGWWESI